jgi:outer membrane receptor protein involved in Fe transport
MTVRLRSLAALTSMFAAFAIATANAQQAQTPSRASATITGRVHEATSGRPLSQVTVRIEGVPLSAVSDSAGQFRLANVPPGPQTIEAKRFGFSPARIAITVPTSGIITRDIEMATVALKMREVHVTADVTGRARGELGTATVVTRDAIANLGAASVAGVLELLPGATLQPPGLDNVQQVSLRTVTTTNGTAERLGAFGTLIILDGVPLSNNANLQTTGPRGEIVPATSAGGGIDLRRIPAAALERVEVIRGVPSARYGDLTQGAIVIDTRAGIVAPEILGRYDPQTIEANVAGGRGITTAQNFSLTSDIARTELAPGLRESDVWRATVDAAHRFSRGQNSEGDESSARLVFDTRLNVSGLHQNEPEQPQVRPLFASSDRSVGVRLSERARVGALAGGHLDFTAALHREDQNTWTKRPLSRGAEPFTDRLTSGRSTGHYVGGLYAGEVRIGGLPWNAYSRLEGVLPFARLGANNTLRAGAELRREWNDGAGYQFDMEFPPQVSFNGVNGFDRPRRFDVIPAVATSSGYMDDRFVRTLPYGMALDLQVGLRVDMLHTGGWWTSGSRSAVLQPRVNAQLAPRQWLRLRAGWGRTAKLPSLGDLYPPPQYYDVVNVNWYPPDSAERLAVLTTSVKDPTNRALGYAVGRSAEGGFEVDFAGSSMSVVAFRNVTTGGVGYEVEPTFLLREHFALDDSTVGTGRRPNYLTPAQSIDTVPVFLDRPRNMQRVENRGLELTLSLPEITPIRTRAELQGAWTVTRFSNDAIDLGQSNRVTDFQLDSLKKRAPYWLGIMERGERALTTVRLVHHQPELGLIITATVQYFISESTVQEAATDTLAWAGYVTRSGQLVPVPVQARGDPQYAGLRQQRFGLLTRQRSPAPDWLASFQVAKTIFDEGRFSFYAFNALDRLGLPDTDSNAPRIFPRMRFGMELSVPTAVLRRRQ